MKRPVFLGTVYATFGACVYARLRVDHGVNATSPKLHSADGPKLEEPVLKQVQVIFRHGARSPLYSPSYLPKVTYDDALMSHPSHTMVPYIASDIHGNVVQSSSAKEDGDHHGHLTCVGAEQLYELGSRLRQRYVKNFGLLPENYEGSITVRSTGLQRAMDSARCTLAGLYPGLDTPVPMLVVPLDEEILAPNFKRCQLLKNLTKSNWENPDDIDGLLKIRETLERAFNISSEEKVHIVTLRDNLFAHKFHNILPEHLDDSDAMEIAEEGAVKIMNHVFCGAEGIKDVVLKLGIGQFVKVLVDNMDRSLNDDGPKMFLFSGHDTTIIPLLNVLRIYDLKWPPFAAHIVLELYESAARERFVKVYYMFEERKLPGCSDVMCPLDEFKAAVERYVISDDEYHRSCDSRVDS